MSWLGGWLRRVLGWPVAGTDVTEHLEIIADLRLRPPPADLLAYINDEGERE